MPTPQDIHYRPDLKLRRPYEGSEQPAPLSLPVEAAPVRSDIQELQRLTAAATLRQLAQASQAVESLSRSICRCFEDHPIYRAQLEAAEADDAGRLGKLVAQVASDPEGPSPLEVLPFVRRGQAHLDAVAGLVMGYLPVYPATPLPPRQALETWLAGQPLASGGQAQLSVTRYNWRLPEALDEVARREAESIEALVQGRVTDLRRLWSMGLAPRNVLMDAGQRIAQVWQRSVQQLQVQWSRTSLDFWAGCQPLEIARLLKQIPLNVLAVIRELLLMQLQELANASARLRQLLALLDPRTLVEAMQAATVANIQPLLDYLSDLQEAGACLEKTMDELLSTAEYASTLVKNTVHDVTQFGRFYESQTQAFVDNLAQRHAVKGKLKVVQAVLDHPEADAEQVVAQAGLDQPLYPCLSGAA